MKRIALLTAVVVVFLCSSTWASVVSGPTLTIQWEGSGGSGQVDIGPDVFAAHAKQNGEQTQINIGKGDCEALMQRLQVQDCLGLDSLDFVYDPDPYVTGGFSVYNPSGSTQTYTFIFTSPVAPSLATSLYGGSMSGSITTTTGPATVSTVAGTPLYWGMIDGAQVLPIYTDPMSWTVLAGSGDIVAVNVPTTNPYGAVNNNISMQYKFTLTPGGIATMNGYFEVIPEPATLVLLGIGSLLLRKRRA